MHFNQILPFIKKFAKIRHLNKISVIFNLYFCRFRHSYCHFGRKLIRRQCIFTPRIKLFTLRIKFMS